MLSREPENENDTLAILWKLEALNGLPFKQFQTLGHAGYGPDLIVHFQEDSQSNPERYVSVEVESRFYNYKAHDIPHRCILALFVGMSGQVQRCESNQQIRITK